MSYKRNLISVYGNNWWDKLIEIGKKVNRLFHLDTNKITWPILDIKEGDIIQYFIKYTKGKRK